MAHEQAVTTKAADLMVGQHARDLMPLRTANFDRGSLASSEVVYRPSDQGSRFIRGQSACRELTQAFGLHWTGPRHVGADVGVIACFVVDRQFLAIMGMGDLGEAEGAFRPGACFTL